MIFSLRKALFLTLSFTPFIQACATDPDTFGEKNLRSGEAPLELDLPYQAPVKSTGKKSFGPLVIKVYVHPLKTKEILREGYYLHIKIADGSWAEGE